MAAVERMIAVAIRHSEDLFLWLRIRRAPQGDIYCMLPTGRSEPEWKAWNPHESHHKDGQFHHKGFDQKMLCQVRQRPDGGFTGTENLITRGIAAHEPRDFGVICHPAEFDGVMKVSVTVLSPKSYETYVSVDLTERGGRPTIRPGGQILAQQAFDDSIPVILVTVFHK